MIIIAFSTKTSRIIPRIVCRKFRHCAPIILKPDNTMTMYQFVARRRVARITLRPRDIKMLGRNGWRFIYMPRDIASNFNPRDAKTCVDLSKRAIGIHTPFIITPDGLFRHLSVMTK